MEFDHQVIVSKCLSVSIIALCAVLQEEWGVIAFYCGNG